MDIKSLDRWDAYTDAKEALMLHTDSDSAPWIAIKSDDKKRARLSAMRFFLSQFEYTDKDNAAIGHIDAKLVLRGRASVAD